MEEKAALFALASERGLSISRMIREDYKLALSVAPRLPEPPPEPIVVIEPTPDTEEVEERPEAPRNPHLAGVRERLGI
ncbi:MAG: hypothetical protein JST59_23740 [Actinobacteria bacterium]|nr:hypothetical protein [Actinomycetota bacterium]